MPVTMATVNPDSILNLIMTPGKYGNKDSSTKSGKTGESSKSPRDSPKKGSPDRRSDPDERTFDENRNATKSLSSRHASYRSQPSSHHRVPLSSRISHSNTSGSSYYNNNNGSFHGSGHFCHCGHYHHHPLHNRKHSSKKKRKSFRKKLSQKLAAAMTSGSGATNGALPAESVVRVGGLSSSSIKLRKSRSSSDVWVSSEFIKGGIEVPATASHDNVGIENRYCMARCLCEIIFY